jgi:hypothetical protein
MNTQELADKMAMEAAGKIYVKANLNRINEYSMRDDILSTIPLVELLECISDILGAATGRDEVAFDDTHCIEWIVSRIDALDAKLGGKV